jgi:pyruvate,orthophosphate dikinase
LRQLVGGKGANLVLMARELGLPVPPGFTITTEACREFLEGRWPSSLDGELRAHVAGLERVGRRFGDPDNPLLVSVRSGAPVSMPGMMDTILNLGLNDATANGLAEATGDAEFAADCLRRFRQGYRDVLGTDEVPDDPWTQLLSAIEAVFRSWNSDRARAYRAHEGIPDDLGTAVTVQAMVFGNRGEDSGTGVLFTRNPSTGEPVLYGDIMFNAQGEDVVAGTHATQPLALLEDRLPDVYAELRRYAAVLERHNADLCDIEFTIEDGRLWMLQVRVGKRSPRAAMRMAIDMAEDKDFPLSREQAVKRVAREIADPPRMFVRDADAAPPITVGLPASPGVATGAIVTTSDAAVAAAESGQAVILVRSETSPEDVRGMARAAGVLTARGGLASHAAVVARGWGIPAVVGAAAVTPGDDSVDIDGRTFRVGEQITIDGSTGEVYEGELPGKWEMAPEAETLLRWAAELGIGVTGAADGAAADRAAAGGAMAGSTNGNGAAADGKAAAADGTGVTDGAAVTDGATALDATPVDVTPATPAIDGDGRATPGKPIDTDISADDVMLALAIKGTVSLDQLSEALLAQPEQAQPHVDELVAAGLAESAQGALRLSAEGKLSAAVLFDGDRTSIGDGRSAELLEQFHAFDARMKQIVTAWQVREIGGEQVLNDHGDAAYDRDLLDQLAALHSDTVEWLSPLASALRRFAAYRTRLSRALNLARVGDQRFVASPRVDSYHSIWFELHEDLIRSAGRRRSEEAAAGRA